MKPMSLLKTSLMACLLSVSVNALAQSSQNPMAKQPPQDFSTIQATTLQNQLPAKKIPYFVRNDEGERYLVGGMVLNVIARSQDTGGEYEMMTWTGGKGASLPLYRAEKSHQALYVIEGQVEFWLNGKHYLLNAGDYASIPAKTVSGFKLNGHRNKILTWATGDDLYRSFKTMGESFDGRVQPENAKVGFSQSALNAAQKIGAIKWQGTPKSSTAFNKITLKKAPNTAIPYVLASGEGERYVVGDQMFVYLGDAKASNGKFIALITEGPKGEFVPPHFHAEHTEIFYPLIGNLTMIGNKQQLEAHPNDAVHITAGTIHSYKMNDHYTKFIGFLTPAVFDNFFRTLGDRYDGYVYPHDAGQVKFDRVIKNIDKLDIYLAGEKPADAQ